MSDKPNETKAKQTKVEDLPDREMTDESASEVKGGAISATTTPTIGTPGLIIPCVKTIKTGGL
jgi:hypothetical protein